MEVEFQPECEQQQGSKFTEPEIDNRQTNKFIGQLLPTGAQPDNLQISYLSTDELPNYFQSMQECQQQISSLNQNEATTDTDWKDEFTQINKIRSAVKYYFSTEENRQTVIQLLQTQKKFILKSLSNLRSNLSKNGLLLVQEVMDQLGNSKWDISVDDILSSILPIIFDLYIKEKSFIQAEAKIAVQLITHLGHVPIVSETLCKLCENKNFYIGETAACCLFDVLRNNNIQNKPILAFSESVLKTLLQTTAWLVAGKRTILIKNGQKISLELEKAIGRQNLENILANVWPKKEADSFIRQIEEAKNCSVKKKKKNNAVGGFKQFLVQAKMKDQQQPQLQGQQLQQSSGQNTSKQQIDLE